MLSYWRIETVLFCFFSCLFSTAAHLFRLHTVNTEGYKNNTAFSTDNVRTRIFSLVSQDMEQSCVTSDPPEDLHVWGNLLKRLVGGVVPVAPSSPSFLLCWVILVLYKLWWLKLFGSWGWRSKSLSSSYFYWYYCKICTATAKLQSGPQSTVVSAHKT